MSAPKLSAIKPSTTEWPTLGLIAGCYAVWALAVGPLWQFFAPVGFAVAVLAITLFSSLQHEVLHGHPFRSRRLNEALIFPSLTLFVPYTRFRDQHLAHHNDETLTDPYDDPESNYMDPDVWSRLPTWLRMVLRANNTLVGRILLGPAISIWAFGHDDLRVAVAGDWSIFRAWLGHIPALAVVFVWLAWLGAMPMAAYLIAAYLAYGILKIRTFLEHRAHEQARGRSVIVDGGGVLSLLFLNNNLHALHHCQPKTAWYRLPAIYAQKRDLLLTRNQGYHFQSYGEVFRRYAFRAKDPVPHPLRPPDKP